MLTVIKFYFFSRHKEIYRAIAREFNTKPFHVYRLAHGGRCRGNKDYFIVKKLKESGIINATFYL